LLEHDADLIGCDLSAQMMMRQRDKHPTARRVQSDAVFLPFPDGH
jgi:ubiquinone/menaquinone biosynthesis C-methylase UbiE